MKLSLLGGASRAGKSLLAHRLLLERQLPYLPLDALKMGISNGLPELGVDPNASPVVYGEQLWPLIQALAINLIESDLSYVLEGDALLPKHAADLSQRYPDQVRVAFLGYTMADPGEKLQAIRAFGGGANDWVQGYPDKYVQDLISEMTAFSRYLERECAQHHLAYFDSSSDFLGTLEQAFRYLAGE